MYLSRTSPNSEGESIRRGGQHLTPLPGTQVHNGTKVKFGGMLMELTDTETCFSLKASSRQSKERRQQKSRPVLPPCGVGRGAFTPSQMGTHEGSLA